MAHRGFILIALCAFCVAVQTSTPVNTQSENRRYDNVQLLDGADPKVRDYFERQHRRLEEPWFGKVSCTVCHLFVKTIKRLAKSKTTEKVIVKAATEICTLFHIETERVCKMIVQQYRDEIFYIARHLTLEPWEACGIVLSTPCNGHYYPGQNWTIKLPSTPKPPPYTPKPPPPSAPKLRVLHLTDLHLDYQYTEGARVECGEPLCCRDTDMIESKTQENDTRSGKFGSYGRCDIPLVSVQSLFEHLREQRDKFDYVMFTGDIPAHDVWNQSRSDQLDHLARLDQMFQTYLPGVPVYWAVGNHESTPCNSFVIPGLPGLNMTWLYEPLAKVWGRWLPQETLETIRSCAGYSFSPFRGFRIISLNNNYCNKDNPWILLNTTDPCGTLQWFVTELQKAENAGEKVHLLMHLPPGGVGCLKVWSHNFYDIINRYESTVVNQFYGHNHKDWFQMFYDTQDLKRPLGFGFVAPGMTPYGGINPVYRIFTVDGNYQGSSWAVLDFTNYYLDIEQANSEGRAVWRYAYNPKIDLQMEHLYPADWEDLIQRMERDEQLFRRFWLFYNNMHPVKHCDYGCKKELLCALKEGRSYDPDLCRLHP